MRLVRMRPAVVGLVVGLAVLAQSASTLNFLDKQGGSCKMFKANDLVVSSCNVGVKREGQDGGESILANADNIALHDLAIQDSKDDISALNADLNTTNNRLGWVKDVLYNLTMSTTADFTQLVTLFQGVRDENTRQNSLIEKLTQDHQALAGRVEALDKRHNDTADALRQSLVDEAAALREKDENLTAVDEQLRQRDAELTTLVDEVTKMEGPKGETGAQGERGHKGDQGHKGEMGPWGHKGVQGHKGEKGEWGFKGERGVQGYKGAQGEAGVQGYKGHKGTQGKDAPKVYYNCLDYMADGHTTSGYYDIKPNGWKQVNVWCDMTTNGGGYDTYKVEGGSVSCRRTDTNSCPPGMDMWVPRTPAHWSAVKAKYGGAFMHVAGIYGVENGCGSCGYHQIHQNPHANPIMNSEYIDDRTPDQHWKAVDGGKWWLRNESFEEPSGDYVANCWLFIYDHSVNDIKFNDHNCQYCFTDYICSTNAKA